MNASDLKAIFTEARPLVEQAIDLSGQFAAMREASTAKGIDWSQVKALLKAQILDERDETGDGRRVAKIIERADFATSYADMLGLAPANMNEKNFSRDENVPRENNPHHAPAEPAGAIEPVSNAARWPDHLNAPLAASDPLAIPEDLSIPVGLRRVG